MATSNMNELQLYGNKLKLFCNPNNSATPENYTIKQGEGCRSFKLVHFEYMQLPMHKQVTYAMPLLSVQVDGLTPPNRSAEFPTNQDAVLEWV